MKVSRGYSKFKDCHKGETGLLIGTGPGLWNIPLPFLYNYTSIGSNRIHLYYDKTGFAPNYYIDASTHRFDTEAQRNAVMPMFEDENMIAAFVSRMYAHRLPFDEVYGVLNAASYGVNVGKVSFSFDPLDMFGANTPLSSAMLQLAYYLGFQTVLIVGMDGIYDVNSSINHFYSDDEIAGVWDGFPQYRQFASQANKATREFSRIVRKIYEADGRRIVNLSEPTAITEFERGSWRDWDL